MVDKPTQEGKPVEAWETLRNSFLHKPLGQCLALADCVFTVLPYTGLALDMSIHYLRFPSAMKPAGQLNNGLFLPCFLWNSLVFVYMAACVRLYLNRAGPLLV